MKKSPTLTQEDFDTLLGWLSADRSEAGALYETIREGLIRFFHFRGCSDAPLLADETINRVALKVADFDDSQNIKTTSYFYGFAANIFLEYSRTIKKQEVSLDSGKFSVIENIQAAVDSPDAECACLENCLAQLSLEERTLVLEYYGKDKSEKFAQRRKLAETMNLKMPALHIKVFRIRNVLRECIENCLRENSL